MNAKLKKILAFEATAILCCTFMGCREETVSSTFEGTEEEYEAVKNKLHPKTKVTIKKTPVQEKQKATTKTVK